MTRDKAFRVRPAVAADCEGIAEAHVDSIRALAAAAYDPETIEAWGARRGAEVYRCSMERGEHFFVAIEAEAGPGGRIIGFSSCRFEAGRHRTAIYVRGDWARRGVGTALLSAAEEAARAEGATRIDLHASLASVAFYRANGFRELGLGEHEIGRGRRMACEFMQKRL